MVDLLFHMRYNSFIDVLVNAFLKNHVLAITNGKEA